MQMFYPDEYNGCFAACPDPIDFRAYTTVDIYADKNAYFAEGPFERIAAPGPPQLARPGARPRSRARTALELVLGTKSRSGEQWDIWEAVYAPVGADGYPKRIWDKRTGVIDPAVAAYWRSTTTSPHPASATGRRSARSSRARSTSTAATWTTTT